MSRAFFYRLKKKNYEWTEVTLSGCVCRGWKIQMKFCLNISVVSPFCSKHKKMEPALMAYDRPSPKLLSFLAKHYRLTQSVPQVRFVDFLVSIDDHDSQIIIIILFFETYPAVPCWESCLLVLLRTGWNAPKRCPVKKSEDYWETSFGCWGKAKLSWASEKKK